MLFKTLIAISACLIISFCAHAQTTWYGLSVGQVGPYSSHYGQQSGLGGSSSSSYNSFFGAFSGRNTNTGDRNVGIGYYSLYSNTAGYDNTAVGYNTLRNNTNTSHGSYYNTAIGSGAMRYNTSGTGNVGVGYNSLYRNTTSSSNVAVGMYAMSNNTTGHSNATLGFFALNQNISGDYNVAIGYSSGYNSKGNNNVMIGYYSGYNSSSTYTNSTALGNYARVSASNQVRIGNSSVSSIGGQVSWSTLSDGRFKENVKEDVSGLSFINGLRPVSYTVNQKAIRQFLKVDEMDAEQKIAEEQNVTRQTGFVAQEVYQLTKKTGYDFSGVVAPKNETDYYTIKYAEFVVPLVKAVQELSAKVESQQNIINLLLEKELEEEELEDQDSQKNIELIQNSPNPFSLATKINMILPQNAANAEIKIYDLKGTEVKTFKVNERGNAELEISGYEFQPGMYIYALIVDNKFISSKKMIITK